MADYFVPTMRLYLDRLVDWKALLPLRAGDGADVEAEVEAYRTILETTAQLAESFQAEAREHWYRGGLADAGRRRHSPPHIRRRLSEARARPGWWSAGLRGLRRLRPAGADRTACTSRCWRAPTPSLMMIVGLQAGAAADIEKYGSDE